MCRLFGFRAVQSSAVHPELVTERNSLRAQSVEHRDGWGIAYYDNGTPVVAHGLGPAHQDPEFERVSAMVSASTVLAHVRLASIGEVALRNAHPFTHGKWTFAHNGTLRHYEAQSSAIEALIAPMYLQKMRGETDSERCFRLFLTYLFGQSEESVAMSAREVARALVRTTKAVAALTDRPEAPPSSMNFLVSNGKLMVATRHHRTLYFSERRPKASSEGTDPPANGQPVQQLLIASEELSSENHWHPIEEDTALAVDDELRLYRWSFTDLA
jgi:glutamine amidotransferase